MGKPYVCQACGLYFAKDKNRYKKHINNCPMPKKLPPESQKLAIQFQQKFQKLKEEYRVEPQQHAQQPLVPQKEVPWFLLPPVQRILKQFYQTHTKQQVQKIELTHNKSMRQLTEDICQRWSTIADGIGPFRFSLMIKHYPNHYNHYLHVPWEKWQGIEHKCTQQSRGIYFQRAYYYQKLNQKIIPKPVPQPGQYPLKYLLNDNWYDGKPVELNTVQFPQQAPDFRWGEFKTNIANFIATYRRIGDNPELRPYIRNLDYAQATKPSRYLLNKTIQQWQHGRVKHLLLKKHPNPYWHTQLEKQTIISMQKWLELSLYYEKTIQCAPGATFLTELPHQAQERNYSTIRRKEMPNLSPQLPVILPPKVKQIRKSIADRVDEIRSRNEERQKIKRKKEANGQLPKRKKRELFELPPQESSQLAINELQSSQIHPIEQVYEQSS